MFPSETVVGFDRGWDSGEEGRVEWLEDEISVGQVGETGRTIATVSAIEEGLVLYLKRCLQFGGVRSLMRDDDGIQRRGEPDIPYVKGS